MGGTGGPPAGGPPAGGPPAGGPQAGRPAGGPPAGGPPAGGPPAGGPPVPPISAQLRRLYVDTATPSRIALAAAAEVFGPEHLLFGTDSPPLTSPLQGSL